MQGRQEFEAHRAGIIKTSARRYATYVAGLFAPTRGSAPVARTLREPSSASKHTEAQFADYNHPDVPGASVAIVQNRQVVYSRGFGMANLEDHTPAGVTTNYRLASVSKQFTAMAVMLLVKDGALGYDDRLTEVLPEFPTYGTDMRIRHLLTHTSGLWDYESLIDPQRTTRQLKDRDVLELLKTRDRPCFAPGSRFHYCNSGYAVLALVVQRASGMPFARMLQRRIFEPLGMSETVAHESSVTDVSNRAYGYSPSATGFTRTDQSLTSAVLGDGGIYSSVTDLAKWDVALSRGALVDTRTLSLACTPAALSDGSRTTYGFGWHVDEMYGRRRYWHDGDTVGFRTAFLRFPDDALTVIVLTNRTTGSPREIAERVAGEWVASPDF